MPDHYAAKSTAMNELYRGATVTEAAKAAGVGLDAVRRWAAAANFTPKKGAGGRKRKAPAPVGPEDEIPDVPALRGGLPDPTEPFKNLPDPLEPFSVLPDPDLDVLARRLGVGGAAPLLAPAPEKAAGASEASPAGGAEPVFKVGDKIMLHEDYERARRKAYLVFRAAAYEAARLVIWREFLGYEARARIWSEGGGVEGETRVAGVEKADALQLRLAGVAGAVGALVAEDLPVTPEAIRARLKGIDKAIVERAGDQEFTEAVQTVEAQLRGDLYGAWKDCAEAMMNAVEEGEDDEPLARMILRVSAHEAAHAVIAKACSGLPARSSVWFDEKGELQGLTKHHGELSPAQLRLIGLAGVVGEAIALYPEMVLAENLGRVYAGLNADDALTAGVPFHGDQPDWEPTPEFAQAVETITTLLTGPLAEEWQDMTRQLIEAVDGE